MPGWTPWSLHAPRVAASASGASSAKSHLPNIGSFLRLHSSRRKLSRLLQGPVARIVLRLGVVATALVTGPRARLRGRIALRLAILHRLRAGILRRAAGLAV